MDRRQKKTREAILNAFTDLLSKKKYDRITVGEIIDAADIGRATFYSHFETKDFLLKELCTELFCHVFDATQTKECGHKHIFECDAPSSVFLHLLKHLEKNDHNILNLLISDNNDLFLAYFKENLKKLIKNQPHLISKKPAKDLPEDFYINHVTVSFVETVRWWIENGMKESTRTLLEYFDAII